MLTNILSPCELFCGLEEILSLTIIRIDTPKSYKEKLYLKGQIPVKQVQQY